MADNEKIIEELVGPALAITIIAVANGNSEARKMSAIDDDLLGWLGPGESLFSKCGKHRVSYWGNGEFGAEHDAITKTLERIAIQRKKAGWPKYWWLNEKFIPAALKTPEHVHYSK